jgi:biopolymer transport protein ExbD
MSDGKSRDSGGATATIVLSVLLLALIGLAVIGGGGALFFFKAAAAQRDVEILVAQEQAQLVAAQMQAQAQAAAATQQPTPLSPEILLEINAAGDYKLAGKPMEYYDDLKAALLTAHLEQGADLQLVISADKETRFDRVTKAVEAAECAGITRHRILVPTSQPPVAVPLPSTPVPSP